jgi:hypothetical protein
MCAFPIIGDLIVISGVNRLDPEAQVPSAHAYSNSNKRPKTSADPLFYTTFMSTVTWLILHVYVWETMMLVQVSK